MGRAATEYRYEKLTWPEINDAVDLGKVCLIPCGAVEQHGPHLPLDVDLVCPCGIAAGAGREVPEKLLVLPHRVYARLSRKTELNLADARRMQVAVALDLLLMRPIRRANLVALQLGEQVLRIGGRTLIVLGEADVKNGATTPIACARPSESLCALRLRR